MRAGQGPKGGESCEERTAAKQCNMQQPNIANVVQVQKDVNTILQPGRTKLQIKYLQVLTLIKMSRHKSQGISSRANRAGE